MVKNTKNREKFFTIKTPKKDSSILDQFLSEFGYSAFETEERPDDSRRSVKQVSRNDELVEEVADFCKENSCSIYLIYKEGNKLMEQLFKGKQIYNPKEYKSSDPTPENTTTKDDDTIRDFLNTHKSHKTPQKNNTSNKHHIKKHTSKGTKRVGVMSDKSPRDIKRNSDRDESRNSNVEVQIKKKRRRIT